MQTRAIAVLAGIFLALGVATASHALEFKGALLLLTFDEGKGESAKDASPNGYVGKMVGATWAKGKFGQAAEFNGKDAHVIVPGGVISKLPNGALTMGAWFYLTGKDGYDGIVTGTGVLAPIGGQCCQYRMLISPGMSPFFDAGAHADYEIANVKVETKKWYHIALAIGKEAVAYLDGKEIDRRAPGANPIPEFKTEILVGTGEAPGTHPVQGYIDDVFLFDRQLSEAEIKELMSDGISTALAISPQGRLPVAWGALKAQRN